MSVIHIRRICRNDIKGSRSENPAGFLDISMYDLDFFFQMVQFHTPLCHLGDLILDLKCRKMFSLRFCGEKKRDDPRSCSEIQRPLSRFHRRKSGKQHRIHSKAESICLLDDLQTISLKIIQPFIFL